MKRREFFKLLGVLPFVKHEKAESLELLAEEFGWEIVHKTHRYIDSELQSQWATLRKGKPEAESVITIWISIKGTAIPMREQIDAETIEHDVRWGLI